MGSASFVVTATGESTQMGHIADMVSATKRSRSPLQLELDGLTKAFGVIAWLAVMVIAVFGLARGQDGETLALVCVSTAISAIPTGLPTFVQTILGSGVRKLAEDKAVVKTLTDVETLGGTTVINSDKTGTLTMNAMTATRMLAGGDWFTIKGGGYAKTGGILSAAGGPPPDFRRLALGLTLCSDATVADDGSIVGDPTEAALVVLAAKIGVDAEETRRALPRRAEVPFDSEYKFMATVHDRPESLGGGVLTEAHVMAVKGAPDVVLDRCSEALWRGAQVPVDQVRADLLAANEELSKQGLRVLAFAARDVDEADLATALATPMALVNDLMFVALVGIIDPLRAEAKDAVHLALGAGIDVRMITGDHTITARAIADELGLGPGVITGAELGELTDAEVVEQLPQLHVFGRVAPEDKLRLARLMQESGQVVAMTGDAVNDAAALKQADVGVAMGSGSEVSKQAAKMVLTDDNFATLVHAVDLGRDIYRRISTYIKLQLSVLSSVLQLMLLATIFDVNGGVALFPMMLLFCKLFVVVTVVIGIIVDVPDPGVMQRPPREPGSRISTTGADRALAGDRLHRRHERSGPAHLGAGHPQQHGPVHLHDDDLRGRGADGGELGARAAPGAPVPVGLPGVPLSRLDRPRMAVHLGRNRAEHVPAHPAHHVAVRRAMGSRDRALLAGAGGRRRGQGGAGATPRPSSARECARDRRLTASERASCERCRKEPAVTDEVQVDDTSSVESSAAESGPEQKRFKFPTALTVLGIVLLVVWVASFFIPSGLYDIDPKTGDSIPGSYHELPSCSSATEGAPCSDKSLGAQFQFLWRSPPYGLYGLENDTTRTVGVNDPGFLYGSAQIFLFVLAVGAFITMAMSTGAIEAGISRLALRFRASPILLIVVLMSVFALGGTSYGMWEETLGFFALMVPLALALGYDRMTAVAIIFLGAGTGVLCSTVNPFATGVASDAAGHQHHRRHRVAAGDAVRPRAAVDGLRDLVQPAGQGRPDEVPRSPHPVGWVRSRVMRSRGSRHPRSRVARRSYWCCSGSRSSS